MRTAALLGICVTAGLVMLGGSSARPGRPALHVVRGAPLTVRGEHFHSREQVRVTAATKAVHAKASGNGVFVVTIRGATRCDSRRVLARGSAGSYAVVKVLPSPACLPAHSG